MARLTEEQKKERLEMIQALSITSINCDEIAEKMGFSTQTLAKFLSNYPKERKRILNNLRRNRKRKPASKNYEKKEQKEIEQSCSREKLYMLHSSISLFPDIDRILALISMEGKFAITDITLDEISCNKKSHNIEVSKMAGNFCKIIISNLNCFQYFEVRKRLSQLQNNNDVIANLCKEKSMILLTASYEVAIKAGLKGVDVRLLNQNINDLSSFSNLLEQMGIEIENTENSGTIKVVSFESLSKEIVENLMQEPIEATKVEAVHEIVIEEAESIPNMGNENVVKSEPNIDEVLTESVPNMDVAVNSSETSTVSSSTLKNKLNIVELSELEFENGRLFFTLKKNTVAEIWDRPYKSCNYLEEEGTKVELKVGWHILIAELNTKYSTITISKYEVQRMDSTLLFRSFRKKSFASDLVLNFSDQIIKNFYKKAKKRFKYDF